MSKQKSALGRGLGALLPDSGEEGARAPSGIEQTKLYNFDERIRAAGTMTDVSVDHVVPNPYQPRTHFDEDALRELAQSIGQLGIIQPITVRKVSADRYELISGERRLKAAKIAGLASVPAYVREADSEAMLEMAIVENVQREQLNPIEIALGYQRLIDECELTQEQVATKVGKNRSTIANFLRLLNLPPLIQAGLRDGVLSTGHARALLPLEDETLQRSLMEEIKAAALSVREVEKRVRDLLKPSRKPSTKGATSKEKAVSAEFSALSDRIRRVIGTKVHIKPYTSGKGGRVELEYYSDEALERIVEFFDQ
ncbi:MAG: ParB/RepB/Spo0J family partition protein [Bacteroidota bacterium]|nr:ParB/RepB/Spo0J family partition protein [Bacteroidota bacterium]